MAMYKNTLRQCVELIPMLLFLLNIVLYACFVASEFYEITFMMDVFYLIIQQFIEMSFLGLVCLYYISFRDKWADVPKICLYGLTALWCNNLPYIIWHFHIGAYFSIVSLIIYCIVIIFAVRRLTNR